MNNASGGEGRERGEHAETGALFPTDGQFSTVVPLSQIDDEAAPALGARASDEQGEEPTLVPPRPSHVPHLPHMSRPARGVGQSWHFMAAVIVLSVAAGVAAGTFMIRSLRPAGSYRPAPPPESAARESADKPPGTEPAAEPLTPRTSEPAPQTDESKGAVETVAREASAETDRKVESLSASARPPKTSPHADESAAGRPSETKSRARTRARASGDAPPAPKLTRADAGPRRPERRAAVSPERNLPISSPPPSAKPRKVIQWP